MTGSVIAILTVALGYILFVLVRLGVHQRLPLVLRPVSVDQIIDRAARIHGDRALFTCDAPAEWFVPALRSLYPDETQWTARRIKTTAGFVAGYATFTHPRSFGQLHLSKGAAFAPLPEPRYLHPSSLLVVF